MKINKNICLILIMLLHASALATQNVEEIIAGSELIRVVKSNKSFMAKGEVTPFRNGKAGTQIIVDAYIPPGQITGLLRFRSPAGDKGKLLLKDGNTLWFYAPSTGVTMSLPPQRRLLGQLSNSELLSVDFLNDYNARLVGEEIIGDGNRIERSCFKIELTASNNNTPYPMAEYWVDIKNLYPIKVKFYSDSGQLQKILFYRRFETQLGSIHPTELVFIDGLDVQSVSRFRLSNYSYTSFPTFWLKKEELSNLKFD